MLFTEPIRKQSGLGVYFDRVDPDELLSTFDLVLLPTLARGLTTVIFIHFLPSMIHIVLVCTKNKGCIVFGIYFIKTRCDRINAEEYSFSPNLQNNEDCPL